MALPIPLIASTAGRFLPAIAARLNVGARMSEVLNFAKSNPTTFMLAAKETYDQGMSLWDAMFDANPTKMAKVEQSMAESDSARSRFDPASSISESTLVDLDQLADEMDTISVAIQAVGSWDALMQLRRVMSFNDDVFATYLKVKRLGQRTV